MSRSEPCVRIRSPHGYVNEDTKKLLRPIVFSKLGLSDLEEAWNQVGPDAIVTYTVKHRPPNNVTLDDIMEAIDKCSEWEFCVGLGAKHKPIIISLDDDSPHIACSAASGAGKSVLAMLIAIQVLRKGGRVLIIDKKGSHRWARELPGVTYCTKVADMHAALIGTADLAETRNTQAMEEEEDWDPGERVLVIFEEMNSTVTQLRAYWERMKDSLWDSADGKAPKLSPAIQAFRDIMCMGRSAKVNLFGVAQMLTANTCGGPDARENFNVRCLARYTANNWKMLAPQCAMPRKSKQRGRWQVVIGDNVYETQVAFPATPAGRLDIDAVRAFVGSDPRTEPPTVGRRTAPVAQADNSAHTVLPAGDVGPPRQAGTAVGLREAVKRGIVRGSIEAVRHHRKNDPNFPTSVGTRGTEKLYDSGELTIWQAEKDQVNA